MQKVINELLILGYNFKLKGTQYLLDSIIYVYSNKNEEMLENLEKNVYKYVSLKNNKTVLNIKTNIINSTNYVYDYQNSEILFRYFSSNVKITPKLVIATVLKKIHMWLVELWKNYNWFLIDVNTDIYFEKVCVDKSDCLCYIII